MRLRARPMRRARLRHRAPQVLRVREDGRLGAHRPAQGARHVRREPVARVLHDVCRERPEHVHERLPPDDERLQERAGDGWHDRDVARRVAAGEAGRRGAGGMSARLDAARRDVREPPGGREGEPELLLQHRVEPARQEGRGAVSRAGPHDARGARCRREGGVRRRVAQHGRHARRQGVPAAGVRGLRRRERVQVLVDREAQVRAFTVAEWRTSSNTARPRSATTSRSR